MTVAVARTQHTAAALRRQAACSTDACVVRRLLALALGLDGHKRADAARAAGMDRQTLRGWVHRCNAGGVAGLGDRHGGGAPPRLLPEQEAKVAGWIRTGPDTHWAGYALGRMSRGRRRALALPGHPGADRAGVGRGLAQAQRGQVGQSPCFAQAAPAPLCPRVHAPAPARQRRPAPPAAVFARAEPAGARREAAVRGSVSLRTCGNTCGRTNSPTACPPTTTPSAPPAAQPATPSWPCPTASNPSQPKPQPNRSQHGASGIIPGLTVHDL